MVLYLSTKFQKRRIRFESEQKKMELAMAAACIDTKDLQKSSNIPRPTLNNVISGRNVRPRTIGEVAKALGVKVEEIIED